MNAARLRVAATPYEIAMRSIAALDPDDRARLLTELSYHVENRRARGRQTDIVELQGLGKVIWQGRDGQEYVDDERTSWGC